MKYWEIIADNLHKAGWLGSVSAIDSHGRTIWMADTHRGDGCLIGANVAMRSLHLRVERQIPKSRTSRPTVRLLLLLIPPAAEAGGRTMELKA